MGVKATGIDSVKSALAKRREAMHGDSLDAFLEALANRGAKAARVRFDAAEYAGHNEVDVEAVPGSPGTYSIVASGQSVAFIEFGSGVTNALDNPLETPLNGGPKSWSSTHMNAIHDDSGLWIYRGPKGSKGSDAVHVEGKPKGVWWTRGNPPANAMYEGGKEVRAAIAEEWRKYVRYALGGD